MMEKFKVGNVEIVRPNKTVKKTMNLIIAQNEQILRMNTRIIDMITCPELLLTDQVVTDKE